MAVQPPTVALQPGSSNTTAVKQLQDWLVQEGVMSQADVNTGYGTYGPKTTAAVLSLQNGLGVNTSSGPGYWGPLTMDAVNTKVLGKPSTTTTTAPTTPTSTQTQPTTPTQPSTSGTTGPAAPASQPGGNYDPSWSKYGITQDVWNSMNATQRATVGAALAAGSSLYSSTGNKVTLDDALKLAATDPAIVSKYADAATLDTKAFQQNLEQLKTATQTQEQTQQMQFENERKALATSMAAAGQAYSGFRGKAQQQRSQKANQESSRVLVLNYRNS